MITANEVFKIGRFLKPHGIKGEIAFAFDNDVFDRVACPYLICQIDGIFVPFFIEEYRFKGSETALITFEDIDDEEKALRLAGLDVYFPRSYYEEEDNDEIDYSWQFFIGFTVIDNHLGEIGTITNIDENTMNTLFLIQNVKEQEIIIPASEDFMTEIDAKKKILFLNLPEGLVDIQ